MLQLIGSVIERTLSIVFLSFEITTKVGLLLSCVLQKLFGLLVAALTSIGQCGTTFFEELKRFVHEIDCHYSNGANALHDAVVNSVGGTLHGVNRVAVNLNNIADGTRNGVTNILQTFIDRFTWIVTGISEFVVLIGDSAWMLIMLIPNMLIFCSLKLVIMAAAFFNGIVAAVKSFALIVFEGVISFIYFFTAMPIQSLLGLLSIGIAIKYRRISLQASWVILQMHIIIITFAITQILRVLYVFYRPIEFVTNIVTSVLRMQSRPRYILEPISDSGSDPDASGSGKADISNLCVICQDREKTVVLLPCRHLCLCKSCSIHLKTYRTICPLCRRSFREAIQVYV